MVRFTFNILMFFGPLTPSLWSIKAVKAKTLCDSFEEQLDATESLYGPCISFFWNEKDVLQLLEEVGCYEKRITERVLEVLLEQRRKYAYLFN